MGRIAPEETYSVDTHPERFAPLHTVADALVTYLRDTYEVHLIEGEEMAADLLYPAPEVVRAVRIQTKDPACASLTFVFTAYPGIFLHVGLLHDFHYPVCGCDACDSNWAAEADQMEQQVLAVVTGHYREASNADSDPGSSTRSPTLTARLRGNLAPRTSPQSGSKRRSPSSKPSPEAGRPGHTRLQASDRNGLSRGPGVPTWR